MDLFELLKRMAVHDASDLYLTEGLPPSWRGHKFVTESEEKLTQPDITTMLHQITSEEERRKFTEEKELNLAILDKDKNRYRVNVFYQQSNIGMVIRKMRHEIPHIEQLGLPLQYKEAIMETRGLILVVGAAGSGKTTSIASMLDYRNKNGSGHVITIEDPIEYIHTHRKCIFTQREVGFDTVSWKDALKNALRQRPDVIFIGEIRDAETMEQAINFAETGHLCIATLHATSAAQTIERIANFLPSNLKEQNLYSLAHVLKYVFAQRLVEKKNSQVKIPAIEVLKNVGLVKNLIIEGKITEIRELLGKNFDVGMINFETSLLNLLKAGLITPETAISESDQPDNMRLNIMKGTVRPSQVITNNDF